MTPEFARTLKDLLPALAAASLLAGPPAWPQEDDAGTAPEAEAKPEATEGATAEQPGAAEAEPGAEPTEDAGAGNPAREAEARAGEAREASEAGAADAGDDETAGEGGPIVVEAEEGSVIDDQTFEGEDDGFTPSEEIPVDEPIPFPTDI